MPQQSINEGNLQRNVDYFILVYVSWTLLIINPPCSLEPKYCVVINFQSQDDIRFDIKFRLLMPTALGLISND